MKAKLTLTIEKEVMEAAMKYAKESGQSLSELVENYFKLLIVSKQSSKSQEFSSKIQKLRGIIKTEKDLGYKQILTEEISKDNFV